MSQPHTAVVLVHGLWTNGLDMSLIKYRLRQHGYAVYQFSYHSVLAAPADNAKILEQFVNKIKYPNIHFICHSLGGIVIRHYFAKAKLIKPGRVVTLGTPHQGSMTGKRLNRCRLTSLLLGKSTQQGLLGDITVWDPHYELGSIAGTLRFGMGLLVPGGLGPSDGTVSVAETKLKNMTDHIELCTSHFGLLFSEKALDHCLNFIEKGSFNHRHTGRQ